MEIIIKGTENEIGKILKEIEGLLLKNKTNYDEKEVTNGEIF